jgi:hypothetical protein
MCHFVREGDDSGVLEELLKNSERNPAKSKGQIVYKWAYNL